MTTLHYILFLLVFISCRSSPTSEESSDNPIKVPSESVQKGGSIITRDLSKKTQTIEVSYSAIACSCAQWKIIQKESQKVEDLDNIYLEPANYSLPNANTLWDGETLPFRLRVIGSFYLKEGLPKAWIYKGSPSPARIFKYDNLIIL